MKFSERIWNLFVNMWVWLIFMRFELALMRQSTHFYNSNPRLRCMLPGSISYLKKFSIPHTYNWVANSAPRPCSEMVQRLAWFERGLKINPRRQQQISVFPHCIIPPEDWLSLGLVYKNMIWPQRKGFMQTYIMILQYWFSHCSVMSPVIKKNIINFTLRMLSLLLLDLHFEFKRPFS